MTDPKSRPSLKLVLGVSALGVLAACDGGIDVADGGIRGTGDSVGPVSGFGSVYVNGVRFDTSSLNGKITSNDGIDTEAQLEKGMIVRVEGKWQDDGQGTATALEYDDTLRGTVSDVVFDERRDRLTFSIYGQEVRADTQTVFKDTKLSSLKDGDFVRVSAWLADNGYRASFIGLIDDGHEDDIEVEGSVDSFSMQTNLNSFRLKGQLVQYSSASLASSGLSEDALGDGRLLEVEGALVDGTIVARSIRPHDGARYRSSEGADTELSGPANAVNPSLGFYRVGGQLVELSADTQFAGLNAEEFGNDLLVKVEGEIREGVLVAESVERRESGAKVEAVITQVPDLSTQRLEVGGVPVLVNSSTLIADDDQEGLRMTFERLQLGDSIEVDGIEKLDAAGNVYLEAVKIERNSDDKADGDSDEPGAVTSFELEGNLIQSSMTDLQILGVTMAITENSALDDTEALLPGRVVGVQYRLLDNGSYEILEVDVDDEDDD
ncbi:DUF5666 domain-containing protein [Marinobacter xestospongiae]|uniref:DUF5666 domain-containing protein n=1 Tax=Marinobacter xestospongiae TaxID=994319 RepID=A0ABU3W0T1_9GAMM|nr:DUF5666 domain-containing protein [Marinobacter xestospongiae]MDV2080152.1 DUF5666 domain-containing protein [Marinobacter xestospongiae]